MKNYKSTIVVAIVTTLLTNFLLSSWLFWLIACIALWLYIGYLGTVMEDFFIPDWCDPIIILGPFCFIGSLMENGLDGLKRLWNHFFSKPMPTLRSPFVFDKDEE